MPVERPSTCPASIACNDLLPSYPTGPYGTHLLGQHQSADSFQALSETRVASHFRHSVGHVGHKRTDPQLIGPLRK